MNSALKDLDQRRFPTVASYLGQIPEGLFAYPDCQAKASLLRSILEDFPLANAVAGLPPVLAELVLHPPPAAQWIPEVHFRVLLRVVLDEFFRDRAAFAAWSYGAQLRLLSGPIYRMMFALASPERMAKAAGNRWGNFHRGSTLETEITSKEGIATLRFPPRCFDVLDHEASMAAIRVVIELAGAHKVDITILDASTTHTRYRISWR